jgi:hypothetical protein
MQAVFSKTFDFRHKPFVMSETNNGTQILENLISNFPQRYIFTSRMLTSDGQIVSNLSRVIP